MKRFSSFLGIIAILLFSFAIPHIAHASGATCDIFVDSVGGNDSNNGTSSTTPYQTLSAVPAVANGTTICLRRGSVFTDSLIVGIPGNTRDNITVQDYGPSYLPKPMIDNSDVIPASSWTAVGGSFPNLYQATVAGPGTSTVTKYGVYATAGSVYINMFECKSAPCTPTGLGGNDNFLGVATTQTSANTATGTFYTAGQTGTASPSNYINPTLYLHTSDDTSPITNGYTYSYAHRLYGVMISGNNAVVTNIITKKQSAPDGSIVQYGSGGNAQFNNIEVYQGGKHNAFCSGGCVVSNSKFVDEYYGAGNMLVFFDTVGSNLPVTSNNNVFITGVKTNGAGNFISPIYGHVGSGNSIPALYVNGGSVQSVGDGFWRTPISIASPNIIVNGLTCYNTYFGCIGGNGTTTINNTQFFASGTSSEGLYTVSPTATDYTVTVNSSFACGAIGYNHRFIQGTSTSDLVLSSSTFYMMADGNSSFSSFRNVSSFNNVFDSTRPFNSWSTIGATTTNVYVGDYNAFILPNTRGNVGGTSTATLAAWQGMTLQDAHSTTTGSGLAACTMGQFTFSGPSSGNAGQSSGTFTVTPNKAFTGSIKFDAIGAAGENVNPITLNFNNSASPQTFSIAPTKSGSVNLMPYVYTSTSTPAFLAPAALSYTANDATPPVISNIVANVTGTSSATVSFDTDEMATSSIQYGTTTSYGLNILSASFVTSRSFTLTSLRPGTTYHYRFKATDASGNSSTTVDQVFTTASSVLPPMVDTYAATNVTATTATLNGGITGDGGASSTLRGFTYGLDLFYGSSASTTGMFGLGNYSQTVTGLTPNTMYHFRGVAKNSAGFGIANDLTFTTLASDPATTTPPVVVANTTPRLSAGSSGGASSIPASLLPQNIPTQGTVGASYSFTANLSTGMSSAQVKTLQQFLNNKGFTVSISGAGSKGMETNFFGTATRAALARFQKANNISPAVGYFGPVTRAFIANMR